MRAPLTICPHAGCNKLTTGGRCPAHQKQQHKGSSKNRSGDPFYSSAAWKRVRDQRRRLNPLCQLCEENGIVTPMWAVDHIKPRCDYPELELDIENTRSLCESCHNRHTARTRRR